MQGARKVNVSAPVESVAPPAPAKITVKLEREGSKNVKVPLAGIPNALVTAPEPPAKADANIDIVLPVESLTPSSQPPLADVNFPAPAPDISPTITVIA